VTGHEAGGRCQLRHRARRGTDYEITIIVTDAAGHSTSQTQALSS